jgi:anaerobic selenocysteine-containing dehydrogenase
LNTRSMVLVGRRHLKSNNSWMHNIGVLMKGSMNCSLQMHPIDAERIGLQNDALATISSRVGSVVAPVEITTDIRPGVVSLPHGWGHTAPGIKMGVASGRAGVNSNILSDDRALDPLSGTSVLNGIPVDIAPAQ